MQYSFKKYTHLLTILNKELICRNIVEKWINLSKKEIKVNN